jgi:hypothetical protein
MPMTGIGEVLCTPYLLFIRRVWRADPLWAQRSQVRKISIVVQVHYYTFRIDGSLDGLLFVESTKTRNQDWSLQDYQNIFDSRSR